MGYHAFILTISKKYMNLMFVNTLSFSKPEACDRFNLETQTAKDSLIVFLMRFFILERNFYDKLV